MSMLCWRRCAKKGLEQVLLKYRWLYTYNIYIYIYIYMVMLNTATFLDVYIAEWKFSSIEDNEYNVYR